MICLVYSELKQNFIDSELWYENFIDIDEIDNTITISIEKEENIKSFLSSSLINISKNISNSILIGDYLQKTDTDNTLRSIIKICNDIYSTITFVENVTLYNYVEGFAKIIEKTCKEYLLFYKHIELHLSSPNTEIYFNTSTETFIGVVASA